eukprot:7090088-Karenia_brevis.AAC.1
MKRDNEELFTQSFEEAADLGNVPILIFRDFNTEMHQERFYKQLWPQGSGWMLGTRRQEPKVLTHHRRSLMLMTS